MMFLAEGKLQRFRFAKWEPKECASGMQLFWTYLPQTYTTLLWGAQVVESLMSFLLVIGLSSSPSKARTLIPSRFTETRDGRVYFQGLEGS